MGGGVAKSNGNSNSLQTGQVRDLIGPQGTNTAPTLAPAQTGQRTMPGGPLLPPNPFLERARLLRKANGMK
jgi:hypothetical protein